MSKNAARELEVLIRARYPLIAVISHEETRVIEVLNQIAKSREKRLLLWSSSMGFHAPGTAMESKNARDNSTQDPLAALDHVVKFMEPAIFVLLDFHPFLGNPVVARRLREVGSYLKTSYKSLVLVSPRLETPVELEKEMTAVEFGLPEREELGELIDRTAREVNSRTDLNIKVEARVRERLTSAAMGLTRDEAENVLSKILVEGGRLTTEDVKKVIREKEKLIKRSGALEYYDSNFGLSDVGGLRTLKEWMDRRRLGFDEGARKLGLPYPKGVLLIGVQGCGKSLAAKALAGRWQMPLLRLDVGRVFSSLVGSSEDNLRRAIEVAEQVAPAIMWVDEVEKAFAGTRSSGSSDGGTAARVFGGFITWLQEKTAPVFVMATANDISELPAEFLRKGRFDEIFFVDLPQAIERSEIFRIHLVRRGMDPAAYDVKSLSERTRGFSGAEIEEVVVSGMYASYERGEPLSQGHLLEAVLETVPLSRTMEEEIDGLRKWAAGRARRATPEEEGSQVPAARNIEF